MDSCSGKGGEGPADHLSSLMRNGPLSILKNSGPVVFGPKRPSFIKRKVRLTAEPFTNRIKEYLVESLEIESSFMFSCEELAREVKHSW